MSISLGAILTAAADLRLIAVDSFGRTIEPEAVALGPRGVSRKPLKDAADFQGTEPGTYTLGVKFARHETMIVDIVLKDGYNEVLVAAEQLDAWVHPPSPIRIGGKVIGRWKAADGVTRIKCTGVFATDSASAPVAADGAFEVRLGRNGKYACVLTVGEKVLATRIVDLEGGYHWLSLKLE